MQRLLQVRIIIIILWLSVTILALIPGSEKLPEILTLSDKLNHLVAFSVLFIMTTLSKVMPQNQLFIVLFIYAWFIEIVQYFMPTRWFSALDVVADVLGVILGVGLLHLYNKSIGSKCLKN
jgi:VanZ family protein